MTKRKHPAGRYKLNEERLDSLRGGLLGHYDNEAAFVAELNAVRLRYRRILRALVLWRFRHSYATDWTNQPAMAWDGADRAAKGRITFTRQGRERWSRRPHLASYMRELTALTERWGLNCPWARHRIHAALVHPFVLSKFGFRSTDVELSTPIASHGWTGYGEDIVVRLEPREWHTWDEFADQLLKAARPQWDVFQERMARNPEWVFEHAKPQIVQHMRWLYMRVSPADGGPYGWHAIASGAGVSNLAVRNAVLKLARDLELTLPNLPAGRPPRRRTKVRVTPTF